MMNRQTITLYSILALIILLELAHISIQAELSVEGIEYTMLHEQIVALQESNAFLQTQILEQKALGTIARKAQEMGFVPAEYMKVP